MALMDEPDGVTPLEPDEMVGLKFRHVSTRGRLDHVEQANMESGLQWLSRRKSKDILNEAFERAAVRVSRFNPDNKSSLVSV